MKQKRRMALGVLIGLVNTGYYKYILSGVLDWAREKGVDLRCFATGLINSPRHWESGRNLLFNIADPANIDGLIVISTALERYVGGGELLKFFAQYRSLPIANIGAAIPGAPSFIIDNRKGLAELLAHLVDRHAYRRLAYISGPLLNSEANIRFETYKTFLEARGLPFDPELVVEGDFTGTAGKKAVHTLFRERKARVDAIVAANDMMAFGAIEELGRWGLQVPGDAFVVGFDDIEIASLANLTTVRQPLYEQGYRAAAMLHRLIRGQAVEPVTTLPTSPVIRESCGCLSAALAGAAGAAEAETGAPAAGPVWDAECRRALVESTHVKPSAAKPFGEWVEKLCEAFEQSRASPGAGPFLGVWRKILFWWSAQGFDSAPLQALISSLRDRAVRRLERKADLAACEDLCHQARVAVEESLRREQASQRIASEILEEHLSTIDLNLTGGGNLEAQLDAIATGFPSLGIKSCFLSLFDDPDDPLGGARLILAYDDGRRLAVGAAGVRFQTRELVPAVLALEDRRRNYVIEVLAHRDKNLGVILMEMGDSVQNAGVFDYLCPKLSAILQSEIFIETIVGQTATLDKINKRLEQSNRALQEFAYVASHDLQEPLRKIVTFGERVAELGKKSLDETGIDYLRRMRNAAFRMQKLIDGLLSYSRVTTTAQPFVTTDCNQVVRGVLQDLEVGIEKASARVDVGRLPALEADPTQMRQLFQNLIQNALKFQKPGTKPLVKVYALPREASGAVSFVVEDNGIGIEPRYHEQIFGVFQRLHGRDEYEGSGIGLAVCKKIVERHGGTIGVESMLGAGAKFILRFGPERLAPPAAKEES